MTPVILLNLSLPPNERYLAENILTSMLIPGPSEPKDLDSFLHPLVDELLMLDGGVQNVLDGDCKGKEGERFTLHAWVALVTGKYCSASWSMVLFELFRVTDTHTGDGPAAAAAMGLRKPGNAKTPCRMCMIHGERNETTYYVPHNVSGCRNLPLRSDLRGCIEDVMATKDANVEKDWGISRKSILTQLRSIHFPRSFPIDIMHCVLQNVTPTLFKLWAGKKLAVDDLKKRGSQNYQNPHPETPDYRLTKQQLEYVGETLASSRNRIPAYLGHAPRNISTHYNGFKAAEWKSWLILYGVPLLTGVLHERCVTKFHNTDILSASAYQPSP